MIEQDNFGRNLPSALVKYYNAETAKKAIENINSKKVMNSVLTVEPYKHSRKWLTSLCQINLFHSCFDNIDLIDALHIMSSYLYIYLYIRTGKIIIYKMAGVLKKIFNLFIILRLFYVHSFLATFKTLLGISKE